MARSFSTSVSTFIILSVLVICASVSCLPFVYHGAFGERDSYRMALGYLDSIMSDRPFDSPFLYGANHSYGYYAWLYLFSDVIKANPPFIFTLMNYGNAMCFIVMVVPFFIVVKRYWGLETAIIANGILILMPVWRELSLDGHPQVPAILFMFTGLAFLGFRSHLACIGKRQSMVFLFDVIIVVALSLCLMFRLDAIFMFPLILACLILEKYAFKSALYRFVLYSFLSLLIFLLIQAAFPWNHQGGEGVTGMLDLLLLWHNPARFVENFTRGNFILLRAFTPFLIFLFLVSCVYVIYLRDYLTMYFILPVVLWNYLFWLPNPIPGRHFLYLAPSFSVGIAVFGDAVVRVVRQFVVENKIMATICTAVVFLGIFFITVKLDHVPIVENDLQYSNESALRAGQFGLDLQKLEALKKPIFIVADPIPVIVNMLLSGNRMKIWREPSLRLRIVDNGRNEFIFCNQGWLENDVIAFRKKSEEFKNFYWVVDPYNPQIFNKPFNTQAPISAEKLE